MKMRKVLLGIGLFIVSGFIVTQALAWNGSQHQGYGRVSGAVQSNGPNRQGWHQENTWQNRSMRSGQMYKQGNHNYGSQSRGLRDHVNDDSTRGYGYRGHSSVPAQGQRGNGYCW